MRDEYCSCHILSILLEGIAPVDLHHNLFYSYRGPIRNDSDRDPQLENNVTRALINTLNLGGEDVWCPFLLELGIPNVTNIKSVEFLLQRRNLPSGLATHKSHRILLGISEKESHWSPGVSTQKMKNGSVPDAWVYGNGFAILVESKVGSADFSPKQMECHYDLLKSNENKPPEVNLITWREVHDIFCKLKSALTDTALLLVEQFIQFLEYNGMSGFTGFRPEHFNYFVLHDDNDARRWIRDQVRDFAKKVQLQLHKFDSFYEDYDIGNLKLSSSHCWAAFGPAKSRYRKLTHQSLSLGSNGLRVFVNTELKPATKQLKAVLKHSTGKLRAAMQKLDAFMPFELVLEEKVLIRPRICKETLKMRLHSSLLADEESGNVAWLAFSETVRRLPLPYVHIDRFVSAKELVLPECDLDQAVNAVVEIFKHNHSVVKLLNG